MFSRNVLSILFLVVSCAGGCHAEPDEALPPAPKPVAPKKSVPLPPCDSKTDPELTATFNDGFDRAELGPDWRSTSYGAYFLRAGKLCIAKPRNHPLWLRRKLPLNVKVEFDVQPSTINGDVKAEIFGDGCAFDIDGRDYTATSYVAVLGAHNNTEHWLARMYEHGTDVRRTSLIAGGANIASSKLITGTNYHVELSRSDGKELKFVVDGVVVHSFIDPAPLSGEGHDHFGFNGWDAPSCFDKLVITPLP